MSDELFGKQRTAIPSALGCFKCGKLFDIGLRYACDRCGFPLEVIYNTIAADQAAAASEGGRSGLWKYFNLLPVRDWSSVVSLGEGNTPLLPVARLGATYGFKRLLLKAEYANPTGSFKDRPVSVAVSMAKEFGAEGVVTASSGNAGASVSAYAARAGLRSYVFVPERTPAPKLIQIRAGGATLVRVSGTFSDAFRLCKEVGRELHWMNVSSTYLCPFGLEGDKTIAYELWEALGGEVPQWILVPVGSGPLLVGIYRGYENLRKMGKVGSLPRMVTVQAAGCAPIARAFARGEAHVEQWGAPDTIATGIADPLQGYVEDGTLTLGVTVASGGIAVAVEDEAIRRAMNAAASKEGIFLEPTGAAGIAALEALVSTGVCRPDDLTVVLATGCGLKTPEAWPEDVERGRAIEPTYLAFQGMYGGAGAT